VTALRVVRRLADVPAAAWDALVGEGSPFLEWSWLATLEETGAAAERRGWLPQHLTLWQGERLVGACPLYVKANSEGEFVFDHGWASGAERAGIDYYPKLLVAVPFTPVTGARFLAAPDAGAAVLETLAGALESTCEQTGLSSVHVNFCLPEEGEALARRGWLRRVAYQYQWTNPGFRTFDDYLTSLRSKRRNQVRRERRELTAQGIEIRVYSGADIPDELLPTMFELYRETIGRLYWGRQYLDEDFFTLIGERFKKRLCLVVARQAGRVIAGTFNVEKAGVLYGRYWGTERDVRHLHFNVCYYAAIEHCIARGLVRFEPGAGGEFKHPRGFDAWPTESMHWIRDPRFRDAVQSYLKRETRAVEQEREWLGEKSALRRDRPEPDEST
jgi:predicted N-acyltransferase